MAQDLRAIQSDEAHTENRSGHLHIIPDFVEPICNNAEHTSLFKKMLANPLDKNAADEYAKTVNPKIEKEAKKQNFEGENPLLPVSQVRDIVMSCAFMHHAISKLEVMPDKGAGLRDEDGKPLPDYNEMFKTWTNSFNEMMDNKGYPSSWKGYLSEVIPTLASRRGIDEPFTREETQEVSSQHGKSRTKCNMEELSKGREQASKVLAIERAVRVENKESPMAVVQDTRAVLGKREAPSELPGMRQVKRLEAAGNGKSATPQANMPPLDTDTPMSEAETSNIHQGNPAPNEQNITMAEVDSTQHDTSNTNGDQDAPIGEVPRDSSSEGQPVFPTDMAWYRSQWDEAAPTMGQVLDKPRNALREAGKKLATMNTNIKTRAAHDQEQMALSGNPVVINVELEVPVVDFIRVMILCTDSLVASGKSNATEIEESPAKTARDLLLSRLERAGQPWRNSVDTLIETKADAWKRHITKGTEPGDDEFLWDDEFKRVVLEFHEKAEQPLQADVFADAKNQKGKIGGFQVAGTKRDGTETYQVFVEKGTYNQGRTSFWHIHPASMYRDGLVEDYKNNKGTQITSSNEAKDELMRLRQYKLEDVQISGIAVIPRTTGEGFSRMPTMFIRASVGDDGGPRFWSRSYMDKVWGQAATRAIRDLINDANIPVLTNDLTRPNLFFPQNASKRTCKLWGVEYTGPTKTAEKGEDITRERDGEREPNDGIYESDGGFVVKDDTETPIITNSKAFLRADKLRKMKELQVRIAALQQALDDDE